MSNHKMDLIGESYIHLGQLAEITMGQSPESSNYNTNQKGLPFLQGCAEFGRISPTAKIYCNPPLRISKPGSILISVRAPVGTQNWGNDSYCIGRGLSAIKAKHGIADTKFLSYAILNNIGYLHRRSQGSTFLAISGSDLRTLPVPNFAYGKQHRISIILQSIDKAIDKTEDLIQKHYHIRNGLMHDMFTRGMDKRGKLRPSYEYSPELYQDSAIGIVPKDWRILFLSEILKQHGGYLQTGPFGSQLHSYEYTDEGIPVVMPQDINDGSICSASISKVSERRANDLFRHRLKEGDVIISRRGDLSRAAAINESEVGWVCGTGCFLLRLGDSKLDANFFSLIYRHVLIQKQVAGLCVGSTMPSLNNGIMNKLVLPLMSIEEQRNIVESVSLVDEKIKALKLEKNKIIEEKYGLMDDLLSKNVSIKLKIEDTEAPHV